MYRSLLLLSVMWLAHLPSVASAEETPLPTTLDEYFTQAEANNRDLQAMQDRSEAAGERIEQAAALPDPMVQVTHFVNEVQTRTGPQKNLVTLNQRIPWFGRLAGRKALADAEAEMTVQAYEIRRLALLKKVGMAYYDYAYTGKAIKLTEENLNLLKKLEPQIEEKVRTGGDLNALLRLKLEIGKVQDRLETLRRNQPQIASRLQALLALPKDTRLPWPDWEMKTVEDGLTWPDAISLMASLESTNPELLMLDRQIDAAQQRSKLARLENKPDLTVGLNYIQIGDPLVNPTTPRAGEDPWGITLAMNLPIWSGKTSSARREADSNRRSAESEREDKLNELRADLSSTLSRLDDAKRRFLLYRDELLPLARQALENSKIGYETGRTTLMELIDSERSLLELDLQLWRAAADLGQQRVMLQTLANRSL